MTHEHTGNYAAKHQGAAAPAPALRELILAQAADGRISCAQAHRLARENGFNPAAVGQDIDLLEIRLSDCQLGLFGQGRNRNQIPGILPDRDVEKMIRDALVGKRLPCAKAWEIASASGLSRRQVASACETLAIKIAPCQLGAFSTLQVIFLFFLNFFFNHKKQENVKCFTGYPRRGCPARNLSSSAGLDKSTYL